MAGCAPTQHNIDDKSINITSGTEICGDEVETLQEVTTSQIVSFLFFPLGTVSNH